MADWKRLTSTTGAPVDVNMNTVAYISPEQHGATIYFAVPDQHGKLCSLTVKEKPDDVRDYTTHSYDARHHDRS
jgi:hypothetical protein